MRLTYNWLKEFVDIKLSPQALADKLTMAGLEVVSLEGKAGDWVFEIEITSNRPDWLSVAGVAREVAAITTAKLKSSCVMRHASWVKDTRPRTHDPRQISISIEDRNDCPLYTAKIIRGVKVGPAPEWMRRRLELVGCRSVNNIVDITNYLLFELGEPMHAFDLDKIVSRLSGAPVSRLNITVRRALKGEEITTIDGMKRTLDETILVISADSLDNTRAPAHPRTRTPIALAGIMGGRDSEVSAATKNILLEAAVFDPLVVRRAKRALGLSSESAYRFERGVDLATVETASRAALGMLQEIAGGVFSGAASAGASRQKKINLSLSGAEVEGVLGARIAPVKIKTILSSLGFRVSSKGKNNFSVGVPSHRADARLPNDLIEEVARIYGFGLIPASLPAVTPQLTSERPRSLASVLKNILAGLGLNEVITYSLVDRESGQLRGGNENTRAIEVLNPLSKEQELLRASLIPSLLKCAAYNLNQKQEYVNIFEISSIFSAGEEQPREELSLAIVLCGARGYVTEQGARQEEAGILNLKGILETIFKRLGVSEYRFSLSGHNAADIFEREQKIGCLLKINRQAKTFFALEISLEKLFAFARPQKQFQPLPKYPGISRDISFVLKEGTALKELLEAMQAKAGALLAEARLTDYYKGKQIPEGFRGLTVSCLYRSPERTLTEEEVAPLHAGVLALLTERFGAKIR
ncbi:MAG: phenylalanine--tRNA ligase subunit beta [Candidatus Omnitrophota bacterium]|nr:phenylalanine--tRNA ligase subunit beta [Candidatus Omnitrophota bacterium]